MQPHAACATSRVDLESNLSYEVAENQRLKKELADALAQKDVFEHAAKAAVSDAYDAEEAAYEARAELAAALKPSTEVLPQPPKAWFDQPRRLRQSEC